MPVQVSSSSAGDEFSKALDAFMLTQSAAAGDVILIEAPLSIELQVEYVGPEDLVVAHELNYDARHVAKFRLLAPVPAGVKSRRALALIQ